MSFPSDYQSRAGAEKLGLLWSQVKVDPYPSSALPTAVPGPWGRRKLFSVDFNRGSFELPGDELPLDRPKLVHTWGSCALVTLKVTEKHPYTGVFETGGAALLRFSDATGGGKFLPSIALKFMVDGKPSLNYLALPSVLRAKGDLRPLSSTFSNAAPPAESFDAKLVQKSFQKTANALGGTRLYGVYLPLHHLAEMGLDGKAVASAVVPDRLEFKPTEEAKRVCGEGVDFRTGLAKIPKGTKLFEVFVGEKVDKAVVPFGEVTLDSEWVASPYGDERLFFAHDVGPKAGGGH
jgi:hypothetical protein